MAKTRDGNIKTRQAIVDAIKQHGAQDSSTLATGLGVTPMAVRLHLYDLQEEGMVEFDQEPRPVGRPVKMWQLTSKADGFFPDRHADLTVSLIDSLKSTFGSEGMDKLIDARTQVQIDAYRAQIGSVRGLKKRLDALAKVRSAEGYMAEVHTEARGRYLLVENHCPICAAATACSGLCRSELDVFQAVLGDDVSIERTEHIIEGARRCAYRVARR